MRQNTDAGVWNEGKGERKKMGIGGKKSTDSLVHIDDLGETEFSDARGLIQRHNFFQAVTSESRSIQKIQSLEFRGLNKALSLRPVDSLPSRIIILENLFFFTSICSFFALFSLFFRLFIPLSEGPTIAGETHLDNSFVCMSFIFLPSSPSLRHSCRLFVERLEFIDNT